MNAVSDNRVIVAQFASKEAIASTPHSPRFNNRIPQKTEKVNRNSEKSDKSFALPDNEVTRAIREDEKKRNFNYSEGQEAKASANENAKKVYTRKDARRIVRSVISETMDFGKVFRKAFLQSVHEVQKKLRYCTISESFVKSVDK